MLSVECNWQKGGGRQNNRDSASLHSLLSYSFKYLNRSIFAGRNRGSMGPAARCRARQAAAAAAQGSSRADLAQRNQVRCLSCALLQDAGQSQAPLRAKFYTTSEVH